MKNIVKNLLALLLSVCLFASVPLRTIASNDVETVTFYYRHGVEVIVEVNENLTYEQLKRIADHIAGEEIEDESDHLMLNPQCAAGNHDLSTTSSTRIDHNAYTTSPKCSIKKYSVTVCNRVGCFYLVEELKEVGRTAACHG